MNAASSSLDLRRLLTTDCAPVFALTKRCPDAAQWSEAAYSRIEVSGCAGWGAFLADELLGFIIVRAAADEMEILNLAVDPYSRRQGVATHLFDKAIEGHASGSLKRIFLEVRESNSAAQAFYSSHGFVIRGRRARYYSGPVEDALVLVRDVQKS